jgi:hypothetical protein
VNPTFVALPSQMDPVRFWLMYDSDKITDVSDNELNKNLPKIQRKTSLVCLSKLDLK